MYKAYATNKYSTEVYEVKPLAIEVQNHKERLEFSSESSHTEIKR